MQSDRCVGLYHTACPKSLKFCLVAGTCTQPQIVSSNPTTAFVYGPNETKKVAQTKNRILRRYRILYLLYTLTHFVLLLLMDRRENCPILAMRTDCIGAEEILYTRKDQSEQEIMTHLTTVP